MDRTERKSVLESGLIWPLLLVFSLLAGCGGGGGGGSSTTNATSTIASTPTTTPVASNHAPVVSNAPANSVNAGSSYSYTPAATDADGDTLTFSITNRPNWATFSTSTGRLSGTPTNTNAGTTSGIVISVSDGKTTTAVGPFSVTVVTVATVNNGTATLNWVAPSTRQDGSPFSLSDLKGYNVYEGTTASNLTLLMRIDVSTATSYTAANLAPGTHYFSVTAYDINGAESSYSNIVSRVVN